MKRWQNLTIAGRLYAALALMSATCVLLWAVGAIAQHRYSEIYLNWNLFLAALPLVFAVRLTKRLQAKPWSSWENLGWTFLWLIFLPNSFYMVSDFIHLREVPSADVLYDVVMFASFIFTGVVMGFLGLYLVHKQLLRRLLTHSANTIVGVILLACSFAIYLGRDLRWNSWDILLNPAGLLFDVSDRLLHPLAHPQTYSMTVSYFVLLGSLYFLLSQIVLALRPPNPEQ